MDRPHQLTAEALAPDVAEVAFGDAHLLPERFVVHLDDARWPRARVDLVVRDGRPEVVAVRFERRDGEPPLEGARLRLPLDQLVRQAARQLARPIAEPPKARTKTKRGVAPRPPRGEITDEHLQQVAGIYRSAYSRGEPPTQAVQLHWDVPWSTGARWVHRARARGFLKPTRPRKAGEGGEADG